MKILVSGGAGFLGSFLIDRLINDGHEITVIDDFSTVKYHALLEKVNLMKKRLLLLRAYTLNGHGEISRLKYLGSRLMQPSLGGMC